MIKSGDMRSPSVEYAAFAIGRLASGGEIVRNNRAGIVEAGAVPPLLRLVASGIGPLQHNATFALYGLSDVEDNLLHLLKEGLVGTLVHTKLALQQAEDCAAKTRKRLGDKLRAQVREGRRQHSPPASLLPLTSCLSAAPSPLQQSRTEVLFHLKNGDALTRQALARDLTYVLPAEFIYSAYVTHGGLRELFRMLLLEGPPFMQAARAVG